MPPIATSFTSRPMVMRRLVLGRSWLPLALATKSVPVKREITLPVALSTSTTLYASIEPRKKLTLS